MVPSPTPPFLVELALRITIALEAEGSRKNRQEAAHLNRILEESPLRECLLGYQGDRSFNRKVLFTDQLEKGLARDLALAARICREMAWPFPFGLVLDRELAEIALRRNQPMQGDDPFDKAENARLLGLALSGGGIRSATFNLGVLQALAKLKLLYRFDYLSTVSGGGYIGSWLVAWIKRQGFEAVNQQLKPQWKEHGGQEPPPIRFLRDYSNYLTPQLCAFSADTWTVIATYLRNLCLNLMILVLALSALLLVPRIILLAHHSWFRSMDAAFFIWPWFLTGLAITTILMNLSSLFELSDRRSENRYFAEPWAVQLLVIFPILTTAWLLSLWLWAVRSVKVTEWWPWAVVTGLAFSLLWIVGWMVAEVIREQISRTTPTETQIVQGRPFVALIRRGYTRTVDFAEVATQRARNVAKKAWAPSFLGIVVSAFFSGMTAGPLLLLVARWLDRLSQWNRGAEWLAASWGMPLVLLVLISTAVIHIGLVGRGFSEEAREWWSRLGAWLLIAGVAWLALFGIALYGPLALVAAGRWAGGWAWGGISLTWLISTAAGIIAARSPATGKPNANRHLELLASVTPYIFVFGLLAVLAMVIQVALPHLLGSSASTSLIWSRAVPLRVLANWYLHSMGDMNDTNILLWTALFFLLAYFLSSRVGINEFSMHPLYRNRLIRGYLGASNPDRHPHPFTGFDPNDDVLFGDLTVASACEPVKDHQPFEGPYPIVNATLNLVHGEELAWQERKAAPFLLSPRFCGYELAEKCKGSGAHSTHGEGVRIKPAYRPTRGFGDRDGLWLGTAMAISGAAASPNMGFHSSPPLAFLMTIFNVRLGSWVGNPADPNTWRDAGPRWGLGYLLNELFGHTNDKAGYVYISDGGHFENLGIYELVRRKCRLIVACDATADGDYKFGDLGNAIRKCRDDFGVDIKINLKLLRGRGKPKRTKSHVAIGTIHYENTFEGEKPGVLLYVKASLAKNADEPADVLEYAATHTDFPHDSTADQWFSESQFESYRMLGQHILEKAEEHKVMSLIEKSGEWTGLDAEQLNDYLKERFPSLYTPPDTSANASGV